MIFSWSPLKITLLPLEILDKSKLYSWKFCKIVLYPLINPGNCTSFSVDPQNFNMIFLQYLRKFHVLKPTPPRLCLDFFLSLCIYIYICICKQCALPVITTMALWQLMQLGIYITPILLLWDLSTLCVVDHFEEGAVLKGVRTTLGWKYDSEVKRS